ncbi:iron complex outermembrane receptor protein [Haloferula luteola]|uniref:Iron complex outermembrane receptor protein n=1 Tax=Haloferula luteola TaxID=595692 RepID=A0A840V444_9BACT|nr:TonB-dependent receptor [Haloferula luteola]MBB5353067.1 iron complex outermembrane receptor protein [Haloferula luteola]
MKSTQDVPSAFSSALRLRSSLRALLGICALSTATARAQEEPATEQELDALVVVASADASAAGLSEAYAGGQVARGGRVGLFGSLDYMATPFQLTSYTEELIQNQQAQSVGDVLLNDPAVRVARGFGNFQQLYMVRGLPIYSDDMTYNGLYGLLPRQYLAAELVERVEVFRGANAFLNGAAPGGSSLGGTVNVLPKRAATDPLTELTTGIQSGGQLSGAFDMSRRFQDDAFGVRINGAMRDGDTAVDGESVGLGLIALGLDWRQDRVRLSADLGYQNLQRDATQPSVTFGGGLPVLGAPDASRSLAQPWTYSDEEDFFGVLRGEFDLSDQWTAWAAVGGREGDEDNSFANPTVVALNGATSSYRFDNVREDSVVTGEVGLRGDFMTGPVRHRPTFSATAYELESRNAYAFSSFAGFAGSLYTPSPVAAPPANFFIGGSLDSPLMTERTRTSSVAAADMISLMDDRLILIGGLRYQSIETSSFDYNTGAQTANYSESEVTPMGGILYQITPCFATYVNYIEGLTKGDVAPANVTGRPVVNAGQVLAPYVTEQIEAGVKFDFENFGGAIGIFQSEKPLAGVNSAGIYEVLRQQRYRGLEISAFGEPIEGVRFLGGVSFLDTEKNGLDQIGAPTAQVNVGGEWDLPFLPGVTLDGRMLYTTEQYADTANVQRVPSWTRFDLGLRYVTALPSGQELTLRARVENVTDNDYWASAGGYPGAGYLTVGAPRTLMFSASCAF